MRVFTALAAAVAIFGLVDTAQAAEHRITSLNWEPYVGENLPGGGVLIDVLRRALAANGDTLSVEFVPWARAKAKAQGDAGIVGYYPSWPSDIEDGFFSSSIVFKSPVGFVQRKAEPVVWENLSDLKGKSIVYVKSYGYPPEFQALIESGDVTAIGTTDELKVIKMVAGGRADIGAVDPFVMATALASDPSMAGMADVVEYNDRNLVEYPLVLAMRDTAENRALATQLETTIAGMPVEQIVAEAFQ